MSLSQGKWSTLIDQIEVGGAGKYCKPKVQNLLSHMCRRRCSASEQSAEVLSVFTRCLCWL